MVKLTDGRLRAGRTLVVCVLGLLLAGALPAAQGPAAVTAPAQADPMAPDRGRLLYEMHCIACHTTQMHWRDRRVVQDWAGLVAQVGAWQARAKLGWNAADIRAVAEHLNAAIYRLADAPVRGE